MERTEQEKQVGYSQQSNINVIGGSQRKEGDIEAEGISEEIMAKNFPN